MGVIGTVQPVGFSPSSETPTPPEDFYAVLYIEQNLSASQKLQALVNIGALASGAIDSLVSNISFDAETSTLTVQQHNGSSVNYQLINNQGVSNVALDNNNDLVVDFLNGNNTIVPIHNLFSGFIKKINGKEGTEITIGIDDVANLTEELNSRVPVGITINIDGIEKNLQENPVFETGSLKFIAQELTASQQQVVHSNLDIYSKQQVLDAISAGASPKQKQVFIYQLTEQDLANENFIMLNLESVPNQNEWYDLHINGGFVNDNSYHIEENKLIIHRQEIAYPITANKKVTFRYRIQ
ncbi:hypothetical protein [Paenimyroides baculatum]|uniref:Uncharacterized protein n=1 Tax=Paenimyroides baculatum TaxID=2608000 RepID=A0A5M6CC84_9FLAO|nr:hypothetical protein [Paenimyroides baculatum]KAA5532808.1 hypothetical protein F0460_13265 [Paenimyroides baculatum]